MQRAISPPHPSGAGDHQEAPLTAAIQALEAPLFTAAQSQEAIQAPEAPPLTAAAQSQEAATQEAPLTAAERHCEDWSNVAK